MNQILMVEDKKKKTKKTRSSGPLEISSSIRIFAISIIIFAVVFIGQGSFAMYKEAKGKNKENMPTIHIERVNDTVILTVDSSYQITYLKYSWNDAEETRIPVEASSTTEEIFLPTENSVLNIAVEDETGRVVKYQKEFIVEGIDMKEPEILVEQEGATGSIRITATDETQMAYITYKVNDEDEIRIDKSALENKTMKYILKLERGENKVIVTAVDTSGNIATEEKRVVVSGKSEIKLAIENGKLIVMATDEDGIRDIEINLNGQVRSVKDINQKEVKVPLEITQEKNTVSVIVTNVNSLVTGGTREFNYAR